MSLRIVVHPTTLFLVVWGAILLGAAFSPRADISRQEGIVVDLTTDTILWIAVGISGFVLGSSLPHGLVGRRFGNDFGPNIYRWQRRMNLLLGAIVAVLVLWSAKAFTAAGGIGSFFATTRESWDFAKEFWIDNKPFEGARLFYVGLISVAVASIAQLALLRRHAGGRERATALVGFLGAIGLLAVLPLVVSQRILLANAMIASIVTYAIVRRRLPNILLVIGGVCLGFGIWTYQEVLRIEASDQVGFVQALGLGWERLLYYCGLNVSNINGAVSGAHVRTHGVMTIQGMFTGTPVEGVLAEAIASERRQLGLHTGGGTVNSLGTPFVDFGPAGALVLFVYGFVARYWYQRAFNGVLAAQIYGMIAASIVLSFQAQMWSHLNWLFPLAMIWFLQQGLRAGWLRPATGGPSA